MDYKELIKELLSDPEKLKRKKPFTRGFEYIYSDDYLSDTVSIGGDIEARTSRNKRCIVSQDQFMRELDPYSHDVLFDENIPSICVKVAGKSKQYVDIKTKRMAIPFQALIKREQVIYLTANDMDFTMLDTAPTDVQQENFIRFKQYWDLRNQDGMKNKMVDTQLSYGDAGLLYYFDYKGRIKSRILSYADGFVLCPHNDQNGDRILESVYYVEDDVEYIDSYDDKYMYRYVYDHTTANSDIGWVLLPPVEHGFNEIPLITKRGEVAWNSVQSNIEAYEELYNVFNAIQKRWGWGIFYIKGKFKDDGKKLAGSVVLNDTSAQGNGDAKFLTPPTPQGMIETLNLLLKTIQLGSSTTFILPEDIKMSGDVSGIAVHLTKEADIQNAMQKVIEWQNVADKMMRLFKYGLAKELVNTGEYPTAVTDFENLHINAKFKYWRPFSETEYNNMLISLVGAGILSAESGIELNTVSKPDELARIEKEKEEAINNQILVNNNIKTGEE